MTSGFECDIGTSDEELLRRCKESDETALRQLLRRHERPMYSLLYRMLGNHEDAEEALADVFIKVWRAAASFRGASKFTTWLYRIAGNTARDILRSRKARPEVTVEDAVLSEMELDSSASIDPEKVLLGAERAATIEVAMRRLSDEDRLLVTLYHMQECSLEEMSQITGQNRTNLKVKLFRARQKLRRHLDVLDREASDGMQARTTEPSGLRPGPTEPQRG